MRLLSALSLSSVLVLLPLAAHADTYSITNLSNPSPAGLGETVGSVATNQATSDFTAIVLDFAPTGTGTDSNPLDFTIDISGAFGTETITETGTNAGSYSPGFESNLFTSDTTTYSATDPYLVVFTSDVSSGSGATETIYAELYNNSSYVAPTPEPESLVLIVTGLLGMAGAARRKLFA